MSWNAALKHFAAFPELKELVKRAFHKHLLQGAIETDVQLFDNEITAHSV